MLSICMYTRILVKLMKIAIIGISLVETCLINGSACTFYANNDFLTKLVGCRNFKLKKMRLSILYYCTAVLRIDGYWMASLKPYYELHLNFYRSDQHPPWPSAPTREPEDHHQLRVPFGLPPGPPRHQHLHQRHRQRRHLPGWLRRSSHHRQGQRTCLGT